MNISMVFLKSSRETIDERRKKAMTKSFKPGQTAPRSGQYAVIGPRGGKTGAEVTVTKGEPLPPAPKSGMTFILTDPTKHKSGR
jgi:hypothetical protein